MGGKSSGSWADTAVAIGVFSSSTGGAGGISGEGVGKSSGHSSTNRVWKRLFVGTVDTLDTLVWDEGITQGCSLKLGDVLVLEQRAC